MRVKPERTTMPLKPDDFLPFDGRATWAAMEECQRLGLARSVGVSNFSIKKLSDLLDHAAIPPAVNQVTISSLKPENPRPQGMEVTRNY